MKELIAKYTLAIACILLLAPVIIAVPTENRASVQQQVPTQRETRQGKLSSYKKRAQQSLQRATEQGKRKMQQWGLLKKEPAKLYICADIEGVWERVQTFVAQCDGALTILDEDNDPNPATNTFKTTFPGNALFVCLGDTIDKGPNSIKVLKFLKHMKTTYSNRVVLLLGNRDINKERLLLELTPEALNMRDNKFALNKFRLNSWEDNFARWLAIRDDKVDNKVDGKHVEYQHGASPKTDTVLKLKWMLQNNMGAGEALDFFKKEHFRANAVSTSDFDAYIQYVRTMLSPDGLLTYYLTHADAMYYNSEIQAILMHGGISPDNLGYVIKTHADSSHPDYKNAYRINIRTNQDLLDWVRELNARSAFCVQQGLNGNLSAAIPIIEAQEPQIVTNPAILIEGKPLQTWGGPNPISIIQGRPWDKANNLAAMSTDLAAQLYRAGVLMVFFGHSPVGQVPVILKTPLPPDLTKNQAIYFLTVACDTTSAVPARNAAVIASTNNVTVHATYYNRTHPRAKVTPQPLRYSSRDKFVGRWFRGGGTRWCISPLTETTTLTGMWSQAPGKNFNVPLYHEYTDHNIAIMLEHGGVLPVPPAEPPIIPASPIEAELANTLEQFKTLTRKEPDQDYKIWNEFHTIRERWMAQREAESNENTRKLIRSYEGKLDEAARPFEPRHD